MSFKFKKLISVAALVMGFIGAKEIPIEDGKVVFSEDQASKLKEEMTDQELSKLVDAFNAEIAENSEVKKFSAKITQLLEGIDLTAEEAAIQAKEKIPDSKGTEGPKSTEVDFAKMSDDAKIELLGSLIKGRDEAVKKLIAESEEDSPLALIKGEKQANMKHSATHLLASNKEWDSFAGRNWNKQAAGVSETATDWMDAVEINKLNGDMELFYRENPDEIKSLHRDNFGLPSHWKKKMNVVDRIVSGSIATADISQGRKLSWLPKNKQTIQPEEGKVFPISIDMEFVGHILSEIEASWLSQYNKEGSQAYKITFVRFLVAEFDKKARTEDRIATIKAVFVATPDNATKAGKFMNRQNGLLYQYWKARDIDKKYRAFNLGLPTTANICDYIDDFIKSLPIEVRTSLGLEIQLSPTWLKAYKRRTETLYAMNQDYKGYPEHPKDYPNIKFVEVVDYEGSNFMAITFSDNVEILENLPKEKSLYHFEYLLRKIYVFADYKLGIRLIHIGNKVKDGDPDEFKVQTVWSNNVPIFSEDFFIPVFDNTTGEIAATFNQIKVDEAWATNITKVSGFTQGQVVRIQGDTSLAAVKNVVKDDDYLQLASNFDLKTGGTLTMVALADGKLKELKRTTEAPTSTEDAVVMFEADDIDASLASEFEYVGDATLTITEISNGVESSQVKITGKAGTGTNVTINTVNNISVVSEAVLLDEGDSIEFILVDGIWIELNRTI